MREEPGEMVPVGCQAETISPTVMDLISAMAEEEKKNSSCSALQAVVLEFSAPEDSG